MDTNCGIASLNITNMKMHLPSDNGDNATFEEYLADLNGSLYDSDLQGPVRAGVCINTILIPTVLAFGVFGNLSNIVVLTRKSITLGLNRIEGSTLRGFVMLSVSDLMFCILGFPAAFLPIAAYALENNAFQLVGFFYGLYRAPSLNVFIFASTWLITWVAMERYIAVCHPFRARTIIRPRTTTFVHAAIVISAILINLPYFVVYSVGKGQCSDTCSCYYRQRRLISGGGAVFLAIHKVAWAVLGTFLPLVLLLFCNVNILRVLYRPGAGVSTDRRDNGLVPRVTTTLVLMVFLYLVLVTPSMVLALLVPALKHMSRRQFRGFTLAVQATNLCQAAKFSSNFLLYCVTNDRFRSSLREIFCRSSSSSQGSHKVDFPPKHYQLLALRSVGAHENLKPIETEMRLRCDIAIS